MINLWGWPRPAGCNSGRPVGSVVQICSAIALPRWFIHLIGMNSKFSVFPSSRLAFTAINMHTLCWMRCLFSSKGGGTHLPVFFSRVGAHLWGDAVSAFRHISETIRWLTRRCFHSVAFSSHFIPSGCLRWRKHIPACSGRETVHTSKGEKESSSVSHTCLLVWWTCASPLM